MLVATDIAARGIDIDGITHVINYDLPNVPESYVHRIGRTARAGTSGIAISFCDSEERAFLKDIEKLIKVRIPVVEDHPWHSHGGVVSAPGSVGPPAASAPPAAAPAPGPAGAPAAGPSRAAGPPAAERQRSRQQRPGPAPSRRAVTPGLSLR